MVLFDLGGVLLDFKDVWTVRHVAHRFRLPFRTVRREIEARTGLLQSGALSARAFWSGVFRALGHRCPADWRSLWSAALIREGRPHGATIRIARRLRREGQRVGILSNTDPAHMRHLRRTGWFQGLAPVFTSYALGAVKPDRRVFREVERRTAARADRIWLIDDRRENVRAAREHGWKALHFRSPRGLEDTLRRRGLLRSGPAEPGSRRQRPRPARATRTGAT